MAIAATAEGCAGGAALGAARPQVSMSEHLVSHWAALLHERTGMAVPPARRSHLVTGVALRMRELGLQDPRDYLALINSGRAGNLEWTELVDRLTVQETRFFRDPVALRFVAEQFLPEARQRLAEGHAVQLWSAGCATGEEAYTLAMMAEQHFRDIGPRGSYGVVGSDISLRALHRAREGVYTWRRIANTPPDCLAAYFGRQSAGYFRVSEALRRRVCFLRTNLLDAAAAPLRLMDLVFCQNVLIYFDRTYRRRIIEQLVGHLRPGGYLVLGAGELLGVEHVALRRVSAGSALVYQRQYG